MAKKQEIQPQVNIGLIGHVDHGKTTLTERLSGKWTDTHSEEIKRGITIRLGYADTSFMKCSACGIYQTAKKCSCGGETVLVRKVSFVDAPGHESLMATMLAGTTIMDGAILLVAANETCPQPQTKAHLMALEIIGIKNVIIAQNKIDLVDEKGAIKNHSEIKAFLKGSPYEKAPIIPISAQHGINIDLLIKEIEKVIPTPKRDPSKEPLMYIARSFDINKPGSLIKEIVGGVIGGSLIQGKLKKGDEVEIRPGFKIGEKSQVSYQPIRATITGLMSGKSKIDEAVPGGSIAFMTKLDPSVVKSDQLAGGVAGHPGKLPPVWDDIKMEFHLLERVVGSKEDIAVDPIKINETLMLNVNSAATVGIVSSIKAQNVHCKLKLPVCAKPGSRVTISRRFGNRWRLIGYGLLNE